MLFKVLLRMIERKNFNTVDEMLEKLNILMLNDQITIEQYNELVKLLEE